MSTTHGPSESSLGAVPQPPPGGPPEHPDDDLDPSSARSGDTAVVFRLSRDVPFLHRLRELASDRLERLLENPRMVIAGAVTLLGIGALTVIIGGAYRTHPGPVSEPTPAARPIVLPLPPQAAPPAQPAPVVAAPVAPAVVEAITEAPPPPRPVLRQRKPRPRVAAAPVQAAPVARVPLAAPPTHPGPRPATPAARW